jgi:hypothetical protein
MSRYVGSGCIQSRVKIKIPCAFVKGGAAFEAAGDFD